MARDVVTERRESSVEFRVRYSETDQMGVAYHGHYLAWCEMARTEHMRRLGVRYRDLEDRGVRLAVSEAHVRFAKSARYDDPLRVSAWLTAVASRRLAFGYRIERTDDDAVLATAETALVSIDGTGRLTRLPDDVLAHLEELMDA
ncbi:MAG TPA: thioesterase family protein [Gemmatimonadales bacterium]|nr:thioesterase family protein [Gemmatimonadales bacterium]